MAANTYRPVSSRAKALHPDGDFEATYTAGEERDLLEAGHVEIVPQPYEVLSNNYSAGAQGDVVELALPVDIEAALTEGGHIKRAEKKPAKKAAAKQ